LKKKEFIHFKYDRKLNEETNMSYYISKVIDLPFEKAIERTTDELKKKLDVDFRKYRILGACNPPYAYAALKNERMIGAMLPCNVIVQETDDGKTEIAAIDPIASMQAIDNPALGQVAVEVQGELKKVVDSI